MQRVTLLVLHDAPAPSLSSTPPALLSIIVIRLVSVVGSLPAVMCMAGIARAPTLTAIFQPPLVLKVGPSLHRDLRAVEFALGRIVSASLARLSSRLASVTP